MLRSRILYFSLSICVACQEGNHESQQEINSNENLVDTIDTAIKVEAPPKEKVFKLEEWNKEIPPSLRSYINDSLVEWSIVDSSQFIERANKYYGTDSSVINVARGDFNGDGLTDFACLLDLKDYSNRMRSIGLWVFHQNENGYEKMFLDTLSRPDHENVKWRIGLAYIPKGPFRYLSAADFPEDKIPEELNYASISLIIFEKSSKRYFWFEDRYEVVWTGD